MSFVPLLTSDILDVHYDDAQGWLYLDWKGRQELELVQAACEQVTTLFRQTGANKALNDNTRITETTWELFTWVAQEYLPKASGVGLEYVAWVQSPRLECRSNIDLLPFFIDNTPQVGIFDDVASAYCWLSSVNVPAVR